MKEVSLTKREQHIFDQALHGDYDAFTEPFFRLPFSGTWYTPADRVDVFEQLYDAWKVSGRPDQTLDALVGEAPVAFKVFYLPEHNGEPAFLYHHGYILLDWAREMLDCGKMVFVGEGGTGSGKTSSIGISALMMCALHGGFDFLNVAPTATQATEMLDEVTKWVTDSLYGERFVVPTRNNELFLKKPFPLMTINAGQGSFSTFGCMTLGIHGNYILGKGKDWINVDEASLVLDIGESIPRLVTRYRGTRRTGMPRHSRPAFSAITNPHINFSFDELKHKAKEDMESDGRVYHFTHLRSTDNLYITASQLDFQRAVLDQNQQDRWLEGRDDVFKTLGIIPAVIIDQCHAPWLDGLVQQLVDEKDLYEMREDMGIIHYELSPDETRDYLVFGDPGSADALSLSINGIPVAGVLDITDFPSGPASLVCLRMIDGGGRYGPWVEYMKYLMVKYRCGGCFDATSTQKSFLEYGFELYPNVYPVSLAGNNKATARTMFLLFAGDGLFAWPRIRVIWHQAAAYREGGVGVDKIPDDVTSALFVAAFYMRAQFYDSLAAMFKWEELEEHPLTTIDKLKHDFYPRYARTGGGRQRYARTPR